MKLLLILIVVTFTNAIFAQDSKLVDLIKIDALKDPQGVTGDVLINDMKTEADKSKVTTEEVCEDEKKDEDSQELVLIFTGEYNPGPVITINNQAIVSPDASLLDPTDEELKNLNTKSSTEMLALAKQKASYGTDPMGTFGNLLLLGASQMYDPAKINDPAHSKSVVTWMAGQVKGLNLDHDAQVRLIASISETLYQNYNDPRNVTKDADNDPRFWSTQAMGLFSPNGVQNNMGGVCDDIAYLGCDLYQSINPNEDCLTMHGAGQGGTQHFVMLLGNKGTQNYTTINGGLIDNVKGANYLSIDPGPGNGDIGTNIRLNRSYNGKHQSIALLKNEYGQWMEKTMDVEGKPGSSVVKDVDGSTLQNLGAAFEKKVIDGETKKQVNTKFGVAQGYMASSGSNVVAVYALIDKKTARQRMGIGVSYSYANFGKKSVTVNEGTNFTGWDGTEYKYDPLLFNSESQAHRVHINPYYGLGNEKKFSIGDNQFKIHYLNGVYANIMVGGATTQAAYTGGAVTAKEVDGTVTKTPGFEKDVSSGGMIFDGNLGLSQQAGFDYANKKTGTNASLNVQVTEELGPKDWNRVHGLQTDFLASMKNMTFFLNRVEVSAQVQQKVGKNTDMVGKMQYLGTNVGQNLFTQFGFQFQIPSDMKVYVMTGYGATLGGYKTNQNYLPVSNNSGFTLQTGVTKSNGFKVGAGVRYDPKAINPVMPQVNATIPIYIKPKKKLKKF